jgi:hypothetical protein
MAKFYTGKGDDGTTGLLGEGRVAKHDLRMEAIGSVDEASAALGLARSQVALPENRDRLLDLQRGRSPSPGAYDHQTGGKTHFGINRARRRYQSIFITLFQSIVLLSFFIGTFRNCCIRP